MPSQRVKKSQSKRSFSKTRAIDSDAEISASDSEGADTGVTKEYGALKEPKPTITFAADQSDPAMIDYAVVIKKLSSTNVSLADQPSTPRSNSDRRSTKSGTSSAVSKPNAETKQSRGARESSASGSESDDTTRSPTIERSLSKRKSAALSTRRMSDKGMFDRNSRNAVISDADDDDDSSDIMEPMRRARLHARSDSRKSAGSASRKSASGYDDSSKGTKDNGDEALAKYGPRGSSKNGESNKRGSKGPLKTITPIDRHYLNKALVCIEMQREWSALSRVGELSVYGNPFRDHPVLPSAAGGLADMVPAFIPLFGRKKEDMRVQGWSKAVDAPILSYLFNRFVYGFPCLREAKSSYWTDNIQTFMDGFANRNFSATIERNEVTKRRMLSMGFTRLISTYFNTCITALGSESPSRPSLALMREIDNLHPGKMESQYKSLLGVEGRPKLGNGFNAWVAVPRRDGKEYVVVTKVMAAETKGKPVFFAVRSWKQIMAFFDENYINTLAARNTEQGKYSRTPLLPVGNAPDRISLQRYLRVVVIALSTPPTSASTSENLTKARIQLERFLLEDPVKISEKKKEELLAKAEKDDRILEAERKTWVGAGKKIRKYRTCYNMWRDALIGGDEFEKTMDLLRRYDRIDKLPQIYRDTEEWVRIWVSYVIHFVFVSGPSAKEITSLVSRFHRLIPYELLKQGLRLVNPTLAIRAVVATVMGQPMGAQSLFQRIFGIVMGSDIRSKAKEIERLKKAFGDDQIADVLERYVYANREAQETVREASYKENVEIIVQIVERAAISDEKLDQVKRWQRVYAEAARTRRESPDAQKFQEAKDLLYSYCIKRDREQVLEIVNESNTPTLIKESISVFYSAIYKVSQASNLARVLGDIQAFLDDFLQLLETGRCGIPDILKLIDRHEPSLWTFLHEVVRHGDLCEPIKEWCRSGLDFIKTGIPSRPESPTGGVARRLGVRIEDLLKTEATETCHEVLDEVRSLAEWTKYSKALTDLRYRVDILAKEGVEMDYNSLAEELIGRDRGAAAYLHRFAKASGEGKEKDRLNWVWWVTDEVFNGLGDVRVDATKEADKADPQAKNKNGPKSPGGESKTSFVNGKSDGVSEREAMFRLPSPPRLHATQTLLEAYLDQIVDPLVNARRATSKDS